MKRLKKAYVTLTAYHGTTLDRAKQIIQSGEIIPGSETGIKNFDYDNPNNGYIQQNGAIYLAINLGLLLWSVARISTSNLVIFKVQIPRDPKKIGPDTEAFDLWDEPMPEDYDSEEFFDKDGNPLTGWDRWNKLDDEIKLDQAVNTAEQFVYYDKIPMSNIISVYYAPNLNNVPWSPNESHFKEFSLEEFKKIIENEEL